MPCKSKGISSSKRHKAKSSPNSEHTASLLVDMTPLSAREYTPVPPTCLFDLFMPLLEFYIMEKATDHTAAPVEVDENSAHGSNTVDCTAARWEMKRKALSLITFPECVIRYLRSTPVLVQEAAQRDNVQNGETPARKRHRTSNGNQEGGVVISSDLKNDKEVLLEYLTVGVVPFLPPFTDDSAYIVCQELSYVFRHWSHKTAGLSINTQLLGVAKTAGLDVMRQCLPCCALACSVFQAHIVARLQAMSVVPRVLRVCRRLGMTKKEVGALTYLLTCHSGNQLPSVVTAPLGPAALAFFNDLTPKELLRFLSEDRLHIKQGLVTSDIKYRANFMECKFGMPQEALSALTGDELSAEQLIKLEHTALAEVLLAEKLATSIGGVAHTVDGRNLKTCSPRSSADVEQSSRLHLRASEESESSLGRSDTSVAESEQVEEVLCKIGEQFGVAAVPHELLSHFNVSGVRSTLRSSTLSSAMPSPPLGVTVRHPTGSTGEGPPDNEQQDALLAPGLAGGMPLKPGTSKDTEGGSSPAYSPAEAPTQTPYTTDIEYMEEAFKVLANLIKIRTAEGDIKDDNEEFYVPKNKVEATLRELKGKVRVATAIHRARVEATLRAGNFMPCIEQLSRKLCLSEMEKQVMLLMVGNVISHDILIAINGRYVMRDGQRCLTVGYILFVLCDGLQDRIASRKAFYQSSPLVANGIISLSLESISRSCFNTDLMDYVCDIDRKIVDHLMGTDTETAELVPGSRLYFPSVPMENVVLPQETTDLVLSTIAHYDMFEQCKKTCGFGAGLGCSSNGLVFLFYGPSGTGKTMLANAVAHKLGKRILLVNVAQFKGDTKAPDALRFIFREANLHDAIIFFDECEGLFEQRETNPLVTTLLTEFEKYEGFIIMATNKAQNIDEAMNRRISLMVEFRLPDHQMREHIWRAHVPHRLQLDPGVSLERLAIDFELTGGLIRNAMLAAINNAVARERNDHPTLTMEDCEEGARRQLRGFFLAAERPSGTASEFYVTPKRTLSELILEGPTKRQIEAIAKLAKSRSTLFSQWGFREDNCVDQGAIYLFQGPSGTGKSLAVEGIAYECGSTLRMCNLAELLLQCEVDIHTVFEEGRKLGAVIVFDQAQVLFNHSERGQQISQIIHYHAKQYPRPVVVIATTAVYGSMDTTVDVRAARIVFSAVVIFQLPSRVLRKQLWRQAFPEKVPLSDDVDFGSLSDANVSAKLIRAVAFNVCCKVALLPVKERTVHMAQIQEELEVAVVRERNRDPVGSMFA